GGSARTSAFAGADLARRHWRRATLAKGRRAGSSARASSPPVSLRFVLQCESGVRKSTLSHLGFDSEVRIEDQDLEVHVPWRLLDPRCRSGRLEADLLVAVNRFPSQEEGARLAIELDWLERERGQ